MYKTEHETSEEVDPPETEEKSNQRRTEKR